MLLTAEWRWIPSIWKEFAALHLFHILSCYSLIQKFITFIFHPKILHKRPHSDKVKRFVWKKCIKINKKLRQHVHKFTAFAMKLKTESSCFHWCFYNWIRFHLGSIQLTGCDLEGHKPVYVGSHSWQWMLRHKQSHEVRGIVCRPLRHDCIKAQIWGRVRKHFWRSQWAQSDWSV